MKYLEEYFIKRFLKNLPYDPISILNENKQTDRSLLTGYKNIVTTIQQVSQKSLVRENHQGFYFAFADDKRLNGTATIYKNTDIIVVNYGGITKIHQYFRAACNSSLFPWVTNRQLLCDFLSGLAFDFLISHEFGHHYNGHLLFRKPQKANLISRMDMLGTTTIPYESALERKAIEMDADSYASTNTFLKQLRNPTVLKMGIENGLFRDQYDQLRYWIFATHSFFLLFAAQMVDINSIHYENYYNRTLRQAHNLDISANLIDIFSPHLKTNFNQIMDEIFQLTETTFHNIHNSDSDERIREVLSVTDKRVIEHIKEVDNYYYKVLKPKLIPFARHKLA